jgi:hypothetical protein
MLFWRRSKDRYFDVLDHDFDPDLVRDFHHDYDCVHDHDSCEDFVFASYVAYLASHDAIQPHP